MAKIKSSAEEAFLILCRQYSLPKPQREYQFAAARKWRFDFAWPEDYVAVEIEGIINETGRHQRVQEFMDECEKYNWAVFYNWKVIRFPSPWVYKSNRAQNPDMMMLQLKALLT